MYHPMQNAPEKAVSPSKDTPPSDPRRQTGSWKAPTMCALVLTLLFVLLSSHDAYKMLDSLTTPLGLDSAEMQGCSKTAGIAVMAAVFYGLSVLILKRYQGR